MVDPVIFLGFLIFDGFGPVHGQKLDNFITVDPDFIISFFLGFIKNQLYSKMKVGVIDIIGILCAAVSGTSQISDYIACLDDTAFFEGFVIGIVFSQVSVIIVAFFVEAADAKPPSAILIPTDRFHIAGFDGYYRAANLSKKLYTTNEIKQYITSCNSWSANTDKELYTKFLEKHIKTTM